MSDLKGSFDKSSEHYVRARAEYPPEMTDTIVSLAGLTPSSKLLDVGCGSGQATMEFVARGYQVVAIDPAPNAIKLLAERAAEFSNLTAMTTTLEAFHPDESFDLILCAQAFHWLEPNRVSPQIADLAAPGGHIALLWHMQDVIPASPQAALQALNQRYFDQYPTMNPPEYAPEFLEVMAEILSRDSRVGKPEIRDWPWRREYDLESFVALYKSWSKFATLPAPQQAELEQALRNL